MNKYSVSVTVYSNEVPALTGTLNRVAKHSHIAKAARIKPNLWLFTVETTDPSEADQIREFAIQIGASTD